MNVRHIDNAAHLPFVDTGRVAAAREQKEPLIIENYHLLPKTGAVVLSFSLGGGHSTDFIPFSFSERARSLALFRPRAFLRALLFRVRESHCFDDVDACYRVSSEHRDGL